MRKKVSCFSTRVWAGFLALLGFASCTSNEDPEAEFNLQMQQNSD